MVLQKDPDRKVIEAEMLGSTTIAGIGAAFTGLVGVVTALLSAFGDVPDAVTAAGVGLIGVAALAWAVAAAGDAIARAYATAHVTGEDGDPEPAPPPATVPAVGAVAAGTGHGTAANGSAAAGGPRWMPAPRGIHVVVEGHQRPVAALVVGEDGATVRALWLDGDGRTHLAP